ncbi:MAG TPA: oligosaccharide repeat unit polymerase family protein [Methanobacteriaceae archaeon]|nr:oligosaccharide repeat unit polymerase family protein [Methanobacteriaceae archaeon]
MKIKNIDLFSPYIVVVIIGLYVALALVGFANHLRNLQYPDPATFFYIIYGILFFVLGVLAPWLIYRYTGRLKTFFEKPKMEGVDPAWYSKLKILLDERILLGVVIFSLILQGINLYLLGGIPLFSGYLKFKATTDLWRIAYPLFLPALALLLAKYSKKWYYIFFLVGLVLFGMSGYRTTTIAIILVVFIVTYYKYRLKTTHILSFIAFITVVGIAVGYIAVKSIEWQHWSLNPLDLLFYRAAFTTMVLSKIVAMQGATGGNLLMQIFSSGHPRVTVGATALGYNATITSTIFGPALLDFGAIGLAVQMFLMGLALKIVYNLQKLIKGAYVGLYAIILAHTLIWVETGPTDITVWLFYALALLGALVYWFRYSK